MIGQEGAVAYCATKVSSHQLASSASSVYETFCNLSL